MPYLLNRSKHEEFKTNLALQIRNEKERCSRKRAEKEVEQWGAKISHHCAKISHDYAKISHQCELFSIIFFLLLVLFDSIFPFYPPCIMPF